MSTAFVDLASTEPPQYEANPRRLHAIRAAWAVEDDAGAIVAAATTIVNVPTAFVIDDEWCDRYGITTEAQLIARRQQGVDGFLVAGRMLDECLRSAVCVGYSWSFHEKVIAGMFADAGRSDLTIGEPPVCIMRRARAVVDARTAAGKRKSPSLIEAYLHFTNQGKPPGRSGVHSGETQLNALRAIWWGLHSRGVPEPIQFPGAPAP